MVFKVEHVKSLLHCDLVTEFKKVKVNIIVKKKLFSYFSQSKLYEHLLVLKSVRRDLLVEGNIPGERSLREDYHILFN